MTAADQAQPNKRPEARSSVLHYRVHGGEGLDPLHLRGIADEIHSLVCAGMPGSHIKKISYDGYDLTIEVG